MLSLRNIKLNPATKTPFLLCYLAGSIMAVSYVSAILTLQPVVPLFYSLTGNQQLVPTSFLIIFPVASFTISTAHLLIAQLFSFLDKTLIQLFSWMTVLIQLLLLLAMVRIIWLVS